MFTVQGRRGVAALIALSLPLAACGASSNSATAGGSATTPNAADHARALAFASCMRTHGVPNFPDPASHGSGGMVIQRTPGSMTVNGVSVNGPAFQSAMAACRSKLPDGGRPKPPSAGRRHQMLAFSRCMRAHGIRTFPDPTFGSNGGSLLIRAGSGIDPNAPAFKQASQACGSIIGKAPGGPVGG